MLCRFIRFSITFNQWYFQSHNYFRFLLIYTKWIRFIFKSLRWHFPRWFNCIVLLLRGGHEHRDIQIWVPWAQAHIVTSTIRVDHRKSQIYDSSHLFANLPSRKGFLYFIYTQFSMSWRKTGNFRFSGWKMRRMKNVMNWKFGLIWITNEKSR